mmetsp:Transcript_50166/g.144553  ORF Transcript_50166/g.144553 Transcript_50166/m.144553 type:complete len:219 (+) Transcript_50166:107-763(+)
MLPRAGAFLCCLPLGFGAKLVLWAHLAVAVLSGSMCIANLVLSNSPNYGYGTSAAAQIFTVIWCLIGIPTIIIALWGAHHMVSDNMRMYIVYASASFVLDAVYVGKESMIRDACAHLDAAALSASGGEAFACGVARALSAGATVGILAAILYSIFIVMSYIEELEDGGSAAAIAELLRGTRTEEKFAHPELAESGDLGYDSMGSAVRPFGGRSHRMLG